MAYNPEMPLILRAAQNGGWLVEQHWSAITGHMPELIGAYTDTRDMLDALEELLLGPSPEVNRIRAEEGGAA